GAAPRRRPRWNRHADRPGTRPGRRGFPRREWWPHRRGWTGLYRAGPGAPRGSPPERVRATLRGWWAGRPWPPDPLGTTRAWAGELRRHARTPGRRP